MLCRMGFHRAGPTAAWNGGIGFSHCLGCDAQLVRRPSVSWIGARWTGVPRGYAVVWRPAGDAPSVASLPPAAPIAPLSDALLRLRVAADRALDRLQPAREQASRSYRYLARQIGQQAARTIVLSALCDAGAANQAVLLLAAMMQDEHGGRLLLIDATLGDQGISATLGAGAQPGLSDIGADDPWFAIEAMQILPRPHMFLLGAGLSPMAGRPERIAAMLPMLAERFDHILIQQRAITADSRNLALAARADRILVLAQEGQTPMAHLAQARDAFRAHGLSDVEMILTVPSHGGPHGG